MRSVPAGLNADADPGVIQAACRKPAKVAQWSAELIRLGNLAARQAQTRNRQLVIPNWYSLNGRLVSDVLPENRACPPLSLTNAPEPVHAD
jgi:hypothetical protein